MNDIEGLQPGTKYYRRGACNILVSPPYEKRGWHMSISTSYRNPLWSEIRDAWYEYIPDAKSHYGAILLPPKDEYVNIHQYCYHVHEVNADSRDINENENSM